MAYLHISNQANASSVDGERKVCVCVGGGLIGHSFFFFFLKFYLFIFFN